MKIYRTLAPTALLAFIASLGGTLIAQDSRGQDDRARERAITRDDRRPAPDGASRMAPRFRGMDTDRDGVITRAEWRGSETAFHRQDTDADGVLSGAEVRGDRQATVPAAVSDQTRLDQLNARFSRLDADNDGRLARSEWADAAAAFDRSDADRDGFVTRAEFLKTARAQTTPPQPAGVYADPRENTPGYRAGYDKGLIEGRQAGKEDRSVNGGIWDLEGQRELEQADSGFEPRLGPREDYQAGYRIGFRLGYSQGFGPR